MANQKKNAQFNIISNKSTTHGTYYTGTLNISNLSSILLTGEQAKIDLGLIHAKSAVERGIKFTPHQDEVPDGEDYWVVWVAVDRNESGPFYAGVAACPMRINKEKRIGWKNLPFHVNRMDDALKRRIRVDELGKQEKAVLRDFLVNHNEEMWKNSPDELKVKLS
ncbi:YwhD family protein [Thermoactinomyces sp. CICC 10523]|uniref:YwhD family protein n=1 Tax=Thermoactinomyces sp. CICC 10523 TaxID=2767428 RepID=UPI0018DDE5E3|nr:YwhD family protein [Thermoactinomyces sp. CICC 10523]MBH8597898.1 YwhD family protein [Thermoactinomyces sp. CICC 10523]